MATKIFTAAIKIRNFSSVRREFTGGKVIFNKSAGTTKRETVKPIPTVNVPGLSTAVVAEAKEPVGPGASKNSNYKNPEYFLYHELSYFEAEIEMLKYRLPQPTNK